MKNKVTGSLHFKNRAAYMRYLAYGHIHGAFRVPGVKRVYINGKLHRVKHGKV